MKNHIIIRWNLFVALGFTALLCLATFTLWGQDDETKEKKKARISLEYFHTTGSAPLLRATVKTRVDKVYETVGGVKVNFYLETDDGSTPLGEATSDEKGEARVELDPKLVSVEDSITTHLFLAAIEDDVAFDDADQDIEVMASQMDMTLEEADSSKVVRVFFGVPDTDGNISPLGDISVHFFVKRMLSSLPFGDDYEMTDEDGVVEITLPNNIPGDRDGNLTVIARIEEDEYGIRMAEKTVPWGIPLVSDVNEWEQTLWSARKNTPILLMVVINAMILGIWGVIAYIVTQLLKIKKLGKISS